MSPEPATLPAPTSFALPAPWRVALAQLATVWLMLIVSFWPQWRAMADQWWNTSTYTHMLLVPAIVAWLVALRAREVLTLAPAPSWAGLGLFAGAVILWLAGAMAGVALASQAGAVLVLAASVPALLGMRVGAALLFPLAYLAFLVPFGDELVPHLQQVDAAMTVVLLRLTGVPVHVDGVFMMTPAGLFEIAEACSGVKFLIAMIAFGVLAAHVCFTAWRRRVVFLAACLVVPIVANGLRSWATVFVAQWIGARRAGSFDHVVYGWVFFALVIAGTLAVAWRWFDRAAGDPLIDPEAIAASPRLAALSRGPATIWPVLVPMELLVLAAFAWSSAADALRAPLPAQISLPQVPGWQQVAYRPQAWWEPRAGGADARLLVRYRDGAGHVVDVFAALYAAQGPGRKADGWGEGALRPDSGWSWAGPADAPAHARGDRLLASNGTPRLAQTTYRLGSTTTGSAARLRLAVIGERLAVSARPTLMTIVSAERTAAQPDPARALAAFRAAAAPLDHWADAIATSPQPPRKP